MKQVVHIIRKYDMEKEKIQTLKLEMDYQLATLYDAMQDGDQEVISEAKMRLTELHQSLDELNAFT
ncbi:MULTISPECIES: hypothetical protein [unclassified Psychrobacillus]|uniref:hypothetical protein n=1 Tax=unclassified Psychrobacillus TaxID=2636677 RepID=UPI00146C03B7|nr:MULTISPECIES: hypothetical protein [unclassified Psychrobacillus]MCM3357089.1 hypothetical protein [Psychrobacillus sp. MER TA 171]NME05185.1 hypothetical protein [Psychrobacillus sp. BL-248-WT-3]